MDLIYLRAACRLAGTRGVVLASWNMMIPYLCPELPEAQKAALHSGEGTAGLHLRGSAGLAAVRETRHPGNYMPGSYHNPVAQPQKVDIGRAPHRANLNPC